MKKAKLITANRRQRGFTIIELMITLTIVGVLISVAAPALQSFIMNNRMAGISRELLSTLQTARTEATKRQRNVVVCASSNPGAGAAAVCTTGASSGWIMFVDTNSDWERTSTEELIKNHAYDTSKLTLLADGSKRVSYASTGFTNPGSGGASTTPTLSIVVCDERGNVDTSGGASEINSVARGLIITPTGRARITRSLSEITTRLGSAYINSSCS
jgi:type IV fimbrial biogenesis protein FimT